MPWGKVNELGGWYDNEWQWEFGAEPDLLLEKSEAPVEALELLELLSAHKLLINEEDMFNWWPSQDGLFSVKSCYNLLRDKQQESVVDANTSWVLKQFWSAKAPSKLKVFA